MDFNQMIVFVILAVMMAIAFVLSTLETVHDRRRAFDRLSIAEQQKMLSLTATFFARRQNRRSKS